MCICSPKYMYMHVHSSCLHNSPNLKTSKMFKIEKSGVLDVHKTLFAMNLQSSRFGQDDSSKGRTQSLEPGSTEIKENKSVSSDMFLILPFPNRWFTVLLYQYILAVCTGGKKRHILFLLLVQTGLRGGTNFHKVIRLMERL